MNNFLIPYTIYIEGKDHYLSLINKNFQKQQQKFYYYHKVMQVLQVFIQYYNNSSIFFLLKKIDNSIYYYQVNQNKSQTQHLESKIKI